MAVFNGNQAFAARRKKTQPICRLPRNVREALNVDRAYKNGTFKIEPKGRQAVYDRCYVFEDVNYANKNEGEKRKFLTELMTFLNSMDTEFKITLANQYQDTGEFLASIRNERNGEEYPEIAEGIRRWQEDNLEDANPGVRIMRYLTVTCRADSETDARVYFNALEGNLAYAFEGWGSEIRRMDAAERLGTLQSVIQPGREAEQEFLHGPEDGRGNWKNDVMPRSIRTYKNFMVMGDTHVSVLYASKYRKTIDSDSVIRSLSGTSYPSLVTMDLAPVEAEVVGDKLSAVEMNNEREIAEEMEKKQKAGIPAMQPSPTKLKRKKEIGDYIRNVDSNDESGYFMNLLVVVTAPDEDTLAARVGEAVAAGRKEGVILETCDYRQLKAWNTALPIGGRHVDCMRFLLTSSLVAFQPYHAQDVTEPGGQMLGMNRTTWRFIVADRKRLPNPHGLVVGHTGSGKSMYIKLTELSQTLVATDDDIFVIDPQNEFQDVIGQFGGAYFDLTPKSGTYLNGFEVPPEVWKGTATVWREFVAKQTEYAKTLCAASMKNIRVTQEHDAVVSRCTERMFSEAARRKGGGRQPTLSWLREEVKKELSKVDNTHDEEIVRAIYNCLEEYTEGSCDMLSRPSNIRTDRRLVGIGMANVPENNWEAIMVTFLHYLSQRMDYNKQFQRATHLIVDEGQVVSEKPGSARQLYDAVMTFRKFGGIVTIAMQNVAAALRSPTLVDLFSNCSYKCFLDQGGVDAHSLAAIQEFSDKEFRALSSGRPGEGVMVWNKKVLLFDAKIRRDNPLYGAFTTNFHEEAREGGTS